ncbi:MAG: NADP-dependent isocitrate dehydrogenase [Gammaproteobacteria bacterium]|uniref:NADP-dependent isocitrate dehydrogenase n=1 Tax=Stutzerimonas xanthomarina TaxID=271420 RepID=UPI00190B29BE|nr:NADP-dependent isocitrate dehydrogenase [Stutzerimonas xanthomarina]MBU0811365.1 NADP-dependent isocitrate dehydrogenase [Gammaproteobacteria bacterium]MBK3848700.1 NADP-dependent isocitrate dehydrogenase [Stutzerimonas xanthomarina]MBU1303346.1 NADP-dependent isocitrate dehydrogenase [Gammaproteobacteria bacterium]MBU1459309.1 NADP-dependent isocitrate dehydrogenase [Gammaproteobacteria bacterium]MBU1773231.1 NADP-dependent isocitrate dehydrogenase [Gammaproteobacteria bacterium]|tara:strand:- start:3247 stop:5472 length:2226 start_codon:yes stop_codon:yes gene_type:complete
MSTRSKIIYTFTDEAPALATYSLLPIVEAFAASADIAVETRDISLAGRILASFADQLDADKVVDDDLAMLAELTNQPDANIIKLPNISASVPQLKAAIAELQALGYNLPNFPEDPQTEADKEVRARYGKVLGSAVNPVLREGNSDRRAPAAVKAFARKHPHSMGKWSKASQSHADYMRGGDFFSSEQSITMEAAGDVRIEFVGKDGNVEVKKQLALQEGEVLDGMFMSCNKLREFFEQTLQDCKETGVMWSLHVKATMMKISHPIVFGHAVSVYYKDVFDKYGELFKELGVNPNNGISSVYDKIKSLPDSQQEEILHDIHACYAERPEMAMVDSVKGITNLHIPSDVIVDASMPAMIRNSGQMWGKDGKQKDTKAVMPESTYARIYQEMINFCKTNGAFDPVTMGSVPNVGLMAQKAEEYGSHDKTFEMQADGIMRVVLADGTVLMQHPVEKGDIWRACQTKDAPIRDWVKLAVTRARQSDTPAIFWLDPERAHDRELQKKVETYLQDHDLAGLDIRMMGYNEAIRVSMERLIRGQDTISVTGNVLRDYLTDLFPIMELGTSAKMLSIVPLMAGGGMYETGAGGSAPKHVQQLIEENHLRWDSLGEFLALAVSLEETGIKTDNVKAKLLGKTLDAATGKLLDNNKSPSRRTGELDNRGSHFYLALYWAQELAAQTEDADLQAQFAPLAKQLKDNEEAILAELAEVQGKPVDIGGYYRSNPELTSKAMRPSATFNAALAALA